MSLPLWLSGEIYGQYAVRARVGYEVNGGGVSSGVTCAGDMQQVGLFVDNTPQ